jgi:hypothetical protein
MMILKFDEFIKENCNSNDYKVMQFNIIQKSNPMQDDIHVGIRSVDDIKTLEETIIDKDDIKTAPDWTEDDILKAIETKIVKVYSSKPIMNGSFVTPSKMEAKNYAGSGIVYVAKVNISDIAWIDSIEGQFAKSLLK